MHTLLIYAETTYSWTPDDHSLHDVIFYNSLSFRQCLSLRNSTVHTLCANFKNSEKCTWRHTIRLQRSVNAVWTRTRLRTRTSESKMKMLFSEFTYLNDCFEAHDEGSSRWIFEAMQGLDSQQPDASCFWNQVWPRTTWFPQCGHLPSQLFHSKLFRLSHYTVKRHQTHSNS